MLQTSPYSVQIRENKNQNNFEYGHFLRSDLFDCETSKLNFETSKLNNV